MIIRAALFILALLGLGAPAHALGNAALRFVPYGVIQCPFAIDNGCSGSITAQAGSFGLMYTTGRQGPSTNALNALTALTTDYSVSGPNFNVPCVDYWCGEYTTAAALLDPATSPSVPTECIYNATGAGYGTPRLTCTPLTTPVNLIGFDMTRGGTTCVALLISGNGVGKMTVRDNYWKNNGNCVTQAAPNASTLIQITGRTTSSTEISYNTLDANSLNFPYDYGSCTPTAGVVAPTCNPGIAFISQGDTTVKYNAFIGFTNIPLQYVAGDPCCGILMEYNGAIGCCSANVTAHNEMVKYIATSFTNGQGHTELGNLMLATTSHHNVGDALIPGSLNSIPNIVPVVDVEQNFYLTAPSGGGSASVTVAGTVSGNTLTLTSVTGKYGTGEQLQCGTGANTLFVVPVMPGSTLTTSAGPAGGGWTSTVNATFPVTWGGSNMQGGLDNGSGSAGHTLTITLDPTLTLGIGDKVGIGGANHFITAVAPTTNPDTGLALTGAGTTGTYVVDGSAQLTAGGTIAVTPPNIFPGGWTVPASVSCASQSPVVVPWTTPFVDITGAGYGQVTITNNAIDMSAYNGGAAGGSQSANRGAALRTFNGTITTTSGVSTLTVNSFSTFAPLAGWGLITQSGIPAGTYLVSGTSPTFILSANLGSLGPVSMQASQTFCTVAPTIWGGNYDMAGIWGSSVMNSYGPTGANNIAGNNCGP